MAKLDREFVIEPPRSKRILFNLRRLTKEQQAKRKKEMRQAAIAALRSYFLGDGALDRVVRFLIKFLFYGTFWTVVATSVAITALLGAFFIAPGHTYMLDLVRVAFARWSVTKIDAVAISNAASIIQFGALIGLPVALAVTLKPIVEPALKSAQENFLSKTGKGNA